MFLFVKYIYYSWCLADRGVCT